MTERVLEQNMMLLRKVLPFFSLIGFVMTFIAMVSNDQNIIIYNNLLLGIAGLVLFLSDYLLLKMTKVKVDHRRGFVHFTLLVLMVWGTVMIGYRPNSIVAVFDYILIVLICGLIISIPWQQYGLYITGSLVCLFVLTPLRSFKVETHYIMEVSLVIFGICAVYLSYISYQKTCENFELQEKLEQQSENLEAVVRAKTDELKLQKGALSEEIIQVLTSILGYYDTNSKDHSQHVAELSEAIAREMGFDLAFQKTLYYTGLIHDVGKIRIEKDILNKQGYLNNVEYDLLRQHPRYGYEMTKTIPALKEISKFIFHHHERYDGKGYPLGFKEEAIPKASQILAVADAWDAMRSPRNYREMMSREDAIREMKQNSGKQFSPDVIEAFLNLESRLK